MTDTTWHMTAQQQIGSAAGCLFLVAMIALGIWLLATDAQDRWSIEDAEADIDELTDDLLLGRDNHLGDDRALMLAARRA